MLTRIFALIPFAMALACSGVAGWATSQALMPDNALGATVIPAFIIALAEGLRGTSRQSNVIATSISLIFVALCIGAGLGFYVVSGRPYAIGPAGIVAAWLAWTAWRLVFRRS